MKITQRILIIIMFFSFIVMLSGCGQSGKLYLPKKPNQQHQKATKHKH